MRRILFVVAMALILATLSFAQGGPGPRRQLGMQARGPMAGRQMKFAVLRQLNLTEDQKTQIKNLRAQTAETTKPIREQMRAERQAMRPAGPGAAFDEQAFRAHASKIASLRIDLQVAQVKTQQSIYSILTAEQKAKLQEIRDHIRQRVNRRLGSF